MDVAKITEAPWERCCNYIRSVDRQLMVVAATSDGTWANEDGNLEFIALARNALDVMMRRGIFPVRVHEGWSVWCTTPHGWPACLFGVAKSTIQFSPGAWPKVWSDPFTALIEADKWYAENVEKK